MCAPDAHAQSRQEFDRGKNLTIFVGLSAENERDFRSARGSTFGLMTGEQIESNIDLICVTPRSVVDQMIEIVRSAAE